MLTLDYRHKGKHNKERTEEKGRKKKEGCMVMAASPIYSSHEDAMSDFPHQLSISVVNQPSSQSYYIATCT
jgi:hypothetical protein